MSILITDTFVPSASGFALMNLEDLWTKDATNKVLASDAFTMDNGAHTITAETGLTDDLGAIAGHESAGKFLIIRAVANTTITLKDEDGAQTAADRIRTIGGGDQDITEDEPAHLWYDAALARWLVLAGPGGGAGHTEDHAGRHADGGDDEVSVEALATAGGAGTAPVGDGGGGLVMTDIATEAELTTHEGDADAHHPEAELRFSGTKKAEVDADEFLLSALLNLGAADPVTIAAGVATIGTKSVIGIIPESGTTDDLTDIAAAGAGRFVLAFVNSTLDTITFKHFAGAVGTRLFLIDGADIALTGPAGMWFFNLGTMWVQITQPSAFPTHAQIAGQGTDDHHAISSQGPTFVVAANDANARVKSAADYLCDGTADDVQIQAAIDALPANGGRVLLSEGTFTLAASIQLKSGTLLQGQGRSRFNPSTGTIIQAVDALDTDLIVLADADVVHFELRDFTIDGNKANQAATSRGVSIDWTGTAQTNAPRSLIENVLIASCRDDGLRIVQPSGMGGGAVTLVDVHAWQNDGIGFDLGGDDTHAISCIANRNGLQGWKIQGGNCQLTNCAGKGSGQVTSTVGDGFHLTVGQRCQLIGCQAQDNLHDGFAITSDHHLLVGCQADSNGKTTDRRNGFRIGSAGDFARLSGCYAFDRNAGGSRVQDTGINIQASATNAMVVGCAVYNNFTNGLVDSGTGSIIAHIEGQSGFEHHAEDHAARHDENAADELLVEDLGTASSTDGQIAKADGSGGLAMEDDDYTIQFIIDGGGSAITTGQKGHAEVPASGVIEGWTILADQSGSIVVDVWKDTYANFPPTVADTIAGSEKPTLSAAQKNQDLALGTWTTTVTKGDIIAFNVDSITTVERVLVSIRVRKT